MAAAMEGKVEVGPTVRIAMSILLGRSGKELHTSRIAYALLADRRAEICRKMASYALVISKYIQTKTLASMHRLPS
jgi:hypothetical protein